MKVKDLIELLETVDGDEELVIKVGRYAYDIDNDTYKKMLRAAFGRDKEVIVLKTTEQVGGI